MTWIARLFPPPCIQLWASSDACLNLVTASEWNVNHSRRKEECSLCFSLCFFLALQHFHWVSRTGKECLARKGEKKCCQGQGTQPRDSIHQLHGGPGPTHYLSREAGGHLSPSTVPHGPLPGQTGPHGPCRDLTVHLLPLPLEAVLPAKHVILNGTSLTKEAESSHLTVNNHQNSILSALYSSPSPHLLWGFLKG